MRNQLLLVREVEPATQESNSKVANHEILCRVESPKVQKVVKPLLDLLSRPTVSVFQDGHRPSGVEREIERAWVSKEVGRLQPARVAERPNAQSDSIRPPIPI